MIQRIQSLFLFLVDGVLVVLLFVPYGYVATVLENPEPLHPVTLLNLSNPLPLIGQAILGMLAVAAMTQFKNRPLQMKLCIGGAVLSLLYTVLLAWNELMPRDGVAWEVGPGTYISLANCVLFVLAWKFIKKDEELVKSMDRIR
jgi:hypothetical protein